MAKQAWRKGRVMLASMLGVVALTLLTLWGCGGGGYDQPATSAVTMQTANALVTAEQLKTWIDAGLVNKASGSYDRVVILDVSSNETDGSNKYNIVGHIPGAQLISAGANAFQDNTRAEGPLSVTGNMVCTGATMDALIQNAGIDGNTTIVLTNNANNTINVARAYTTFRYWGFPKARLKVLQGGNPAWVAAGYSLTTAVPTIQKSTYGVAQNGTSRVNTDMRVSLPEMIAYVQGVVAGNANKVFILDTIRPGTVSSTTDLLDGNFYTPFDGAIKGSYRFPYANVVSPASTLYFKDAATLQTDISAAVAGDGVTTLGDANRDSAKTFIVFCRAGNAASVAYFALDGIAYYNSNVDVKWYDGSLGQWNLMASSSHTATDTTGATVNAGGKLAVGSIWDTTLLTDNLTWNVGRTISTTNLAQRPIINYTSRVFGVEPSFAQGNQIEDADRAYRSTVTGTTGGGGSTGGGGC